MYFDAQRLKLLGHDVGGAVLIETDLRMRMEVAPPFGQFAKMENGGDRQTPEALRLWRDLGSKLTSDVTLDARMDFVCWCGQGVENDPYDPYDDPAYDPLASCGVASTTADDPQRPSPMAGPDRLIRARPPGRR